MHSTQAKLRTIVRSSTLEQLVAECREELENLREKKVFGRVSPPIVQDFRTMGEEYYYALEHSQDISSLLFFRLSLTLLTHQFSACVNTIGGWY